MTSAVETVIVVPEDEQLIDKQLVENLLRATTRVAFGPAFFVEQLAAFLRDHCPAPAERLPHVELVLASGDAISICHVIAVGPRWCAVAARVHDGHAAEMHVELVPYEMIVRVTIGPPVARSRGIGFDQCAPPIVVEEAPVSPELSLAAAAG